MPQASDESRERMRVMFGDPIDDSGPYKFLYARGYTDKAGMLMPPKPDHQVTEEEWACIVFLCDEWDYGYDPKL